MSTKGKKECFWPWWVRSKPLFGSFDREIAIWDKWISVNSHENRCRCKIDSETNVSRLDHRPHGFTLQLSKLPDHVSLTRRYDEWRSCWKCPLALRQSSAILLEKKRYCTYNVYYTPLVPPVSSPAAPSISPENSRPSQEACSPPYAWDYTYANLCGSGRAGHQPTRMPHDRRGT